MPGHSDIIERAFTLARSGQYQTVSDIRKQLSTEGYVVGNHFSGLAIRRQLKGVIKSAVAVTKADDPLQSGHD